MELSKRVREYIKRYRMVERGNKVVVAVSGGTDSVALLHLLYQLRPELGISLHVAHLNHMFRGAESEADACFVADLAKRYHLPATIEAVDVPAYRAAKRMSAQVAAREVRYRFLRKVAESAGAAKVALAHQADDQAETIMINFLRGSGPSGLKGILPVRDDFLIRPLLIARRFEIERYCASLQLSFRQDSSNIKNVYLRNQVRMHLLPLLGEKYNPGMVSNLLRLGEICREEDEYLEEQALKAFQSATVASLDQISLSLENLQEIPRAILRRVLRLAWQALTGSRKNLSFQHAEDALNLLNSDVTGSVTTLPAGIVVTRTYRTLDLSTGLRRQDSDHYVYPLGVPGTTYIPELDCTISVSFLPAEALPEPRSLPATEAVLDFDKLPPQLYVRRRLRGDVFCPYGQHSAVKLKDFLIKQKIKREERGFLPLVSTPKEIIWVGGVRVGENWKVDSNTKKVLHLKLTKGD
ncbi:MAG: tRNA lysidine(34) synthetase TilS [Desulfotomaculaceae bacterium]|nr:tRNA lysidine(34) synthetase TilS [Desulfotomaculaceae bacterium]